MDSSPALTYRFGNVNHPSPFSIDRYGGKVTLTEPLDAEDCDEYTVQVIASDGIHEAITDLTVRVLDVNDNHPKFQQAAYIATLSGNLYYFILFFITIVSRNRTLFLLRKNKNKSEEGEKFD